MRRTFTSLNIVIFALLLTLLIHTAQTSTTAEAYWLPGWFYRYTINITGSPENLTDYQFRFTVIWDFGVSNSTTIYCNRTCKRDFGDIRFTALNGTLLPYVFEEPYTPGDRVNVWVRASSIPASPNSTAIYMFWGNLLANYTGNGDAVFLFYDEFNTGTTLNTSKWSSNTATSISNNVLTVGPTSDTEIGVVSSTLPTNRFEIICKGIHVFSVSGYNMNEGFCGIDLPIGGGYRGGFRYDAYYSARYIMHQINTSLALNSQLSIYNSDVYVRVDQNNTLTIIVAGNIVFSGSISLPSNIVVGLQRNSPYTEGGFSINSVYARRYVSPEPQASVTQLQFINASISYDNPVQTLVRSYFNISPAPSTNTTILNFTVRFPNGFSIFANQSTHTINHSWGVIYLSHNVVGSNFTLMYKPHAGLPNTSINVVLYLNYSGGVGIYNMSFPITYIPNNTNFTFKYTITQLNTIGPPTVFYLPIPKEYHGAFRITVYKYRNYELPTFIEDLNITHYNLRVLDVWAYKDSVVDYYVVYNVNNIANITAVVNPLNISLLSISQVNASEIPIFPLSSDMSVLLVDYNSHFLNLSGNRYYLIPNVYVYNYTALFVNTNCSVASVSANLYNLTSITSPFWMTNHTLVKAPDVSYDPILHRCRPEIYLAPTLTQFNVSTETWTWNNSRNTPPSYTVAVSEIRNYSVNAVLTPKQNFYAPGQVINITFTGRFPHYVRVFRNDYLLGDVFIHPQSPYSLIQTVGSDMMIFRTKNNYSHINPPQGYVESPEYMFTIVPALMAGIPEAIQLPIVKNGSVEIAYPNTSLGVLMYLANLPQPVNALITSLIIFIAFVMLLISNRLIAFASILTTALALHSANTLANTTIFNPILIGLLGLLAVVALFSEVRGG